MRWTGLAAAAGFALPVAALTVAAVIAGGMADDRDDRLEVRVIAPAGQSSDASEGRAVEAVAPKVVNPTPTPVKKAAPVKAVKAKKPAAKKPTAKVAKAAKSKTAKKRAATTSRTTTLRSATVTTTQDEPQPEPQQPNPGPPPVDWGTNDQPPTPAE